jgi:hypoxanthine phosphoribosyltransferase
VVHSAPTPEPPARPWRRAIATPKKKRAPGSGRPGRSSKGRGTKAPAGKTRLRKATQQEHPLGMGVADGFAMKRLKAPARLTRSPKKAMRELGWAAFGEVARALAATIAEDFRPDVVVGIAKGGVFVGGALAAALQADFLPVRLEKRRRDAAPMPEATEQLPDLTGKRVLVVDDVASTGSTLAKARALCRKSSAREVRTAVLVKRPDGARPDWFALETDELILFGWDYQLEATAAAGQDPGEVGV